MRPEAPIPHWHEGIDNSRFECYKQYCSVWEFETGNTQAARLAEILDDFVLALFSDETVITEYNRRWPIIEHTAEAIVEVLSD